MISLFHRFISGWFGFNKQQRNGLLVLCIIILVLFGIRLSLHHLIKPESILVADFSGINVPDQNELSSAEGDSSKSRSSGLFVFDPNSIRKEQLIKLGFKEKTANTLINYRNKGGHFSKKEDLRKVYGVSETLYKKLEPFIFITGGKSDQKQNKTDFTEQKTASKSHHVIELNSADSMTLLSLRGIGPGFTKRILKYRNLLGGFYSIEQLKEVYGLQDSTFQLIKNDISVNPALISKININNEDFKALNKHPYLNYEDVKSIFNFRRKNGQITTLEELHQIIPDETTTAKLMPYLDLK